MNEKREFEIIRKNPGTCGIGDLLLESRVVASRNDVIWQLPEKAFPIAPLLLGSVPVLIEPSEKVPLYDSMECSGHVYVQPDELEQAKAMLAPYRNPLVIHADCNPFWRYVRQQRVGEWREIAKKLADWYTLLQFGDSNNFTRLPGTIKFLDMPLRQVAACYKVIGKYLGIDTGNVHLMMAVGGKALVVVPPDCPDHRWDTWHYTNGRARYTTFDRMEEVPERAKEFL